MPYVPKYDNPLIVLMLEVQSAVRAPLACGLGLAVCVSPEAIDICGPDRQVAWIRAHMQPSGPQPPSPPLLTVA